MNISDYGNPQWIKNINPLSFPLSKQEAAERPHVIQNAFHQIIGSLSPSSLVAYTDGSLTTNCSCSCAVFIIGYTGIAKKLTPGSRIYSAKLEGIQLALEFFLSLPNPPEELVICSDSLSAVQAISGFQRPYSYPSITTIKRLANVIITSGIKVSIIWIPSPVGNEGNEMADQLANSVHEAASRVPPTLRTAHELSRPLKLAWLKQLQDQLQPPNRPKSLSRAFRSWFFYRHRRVSIVLHRLRNRHSRLKNHTSRFQIIREDIDGSFWDRFCRFGCPAVENASHFNPSRAPLHQTFLPIELLRVWLYFSFGPKPNDSCAF